MYMLTQEELFNSVENCLVVELMKSNSRAINVLWDKMWSTYKKKKSLKLLG